MHFLGRVYSQFDCNFAEVYCWGHQSGIHDDIIEWKNFPRYWPFVRGIHRSTVNSPHNGQWRGSLMFSMICAWMNVWVNNREAGDLRCHHAHYDVTVMTPNFLATKFGGFMKKKWGRGQIVTVTGPSIDFFLISRRSTGGRQSSA